VIIALLASAATGLWITFVLFERVLIGHLPVEFEMFIYGFKNRLYCIYNGIKTKNLEALNEGETISMHFNSGSRDTFLFFYFSMALQSLKDLGASHIGGFLIYLDIW
jgi:hypothetical protein